MTRRRRRRAALFGVALLGLIFGAGAAFALYFLHKFNPDPPRNDFPAAANALQAQRQDIEQFARLIALDRAFPPSARTEAARQIDTLRHEPALLDSGTLRVALMRIAALADNGHTSVDEKKDCVPIRVTWFADGLFVLLARSDYADLLGAQVVSIDGRQTNDVLAVLEQLHGGRAGWRRIHAVLFVQSPELLYGAGIATRPDRTTWTFHRQNGADLTRTLPGAPCDDEPYALMTRWLAPDLVKPEFHSWDAWLPAAAALPLSLRDFDSAFRRARLGRCTYFIQLKAIHDSHGQPVSDFLKKAVDEMNARRPCSIILDLRFNTGGDYTKVAHFASHLPDFLPPGGRIFILTGPQTFSAAITTAAFVKQAAGSRAVILGEPVGDRLSFYGEGNTGCLPHSGICVHYATGLHDYARPCDDWSKCYWLNWLFPVRVRSLDPDETIEATFADYTALRDPVFERAVMLAGADLATE